MKENNNSNLWHPNLILKPLQEDNKILKKKDKIKRRYY